MAYCTESHLNARYGSANISRWADLDYDGSTSTKASRIAAAIDYAGEYIDCVLRLTPYQYQLPLTTVPILLRDVAVKLAGYWLSTAQGVKNYGKDGQALTTLTVDRRDAEETLRMIQTGQLKLGIDP